MPNIVSSVVDINSATIALTGDANKLVRYLSNAKATMTASTNDSSVIVSDSLTIQNGGKTYRGTSCVVNAVEDDLFIFTAEDSRGGMLIHHHNADMIPYVPLTCNANSCEVDTSGNAIIRCWGHCFVGSFGQVTNTLTVQYRYAKRGGTFSSWKEMPVSTGGNNYSAIVNLGGLEYRSQYTIEFRASDKLNSITTSTIGKSIPLFHWGEDDFQFEVPVIFNAGLQGSGLPESGEWTPTIDANAVSQYTTRRGWYTKTGNVVTVGFFIKGISYHRTGSAVAVYDAEITGLPYVPYISASGGGICSWFRITSGYVFQCYVAEADTDKITVRVQQTGEHLHTSASGCFFPYDGSTFTMSGTITYMTDD